jgi:hypothetical protein
MGLRIRAGVHLNTNTEHDYTVYTRVAECQWLVGLICDSVRETRRVGDGDWRTAGGAIGERCGQRPEGRLANGLGPRVLPFGESGRRRCGLWFDRSSE